jgi:hypothetical protein
MAMPLTLWKLYTTQFTFTLVVIWVTRALLVLLATPSGFWVTFDIFLKHLTPSSTSITQTLTACFPFGRPFIPMNGFQTTRHLLYGPRPVCRIALETSSTSRHSRNIPELTPFWKTDTNFWDSEGVKKTGSLHYTYPEFKNLDMNNSKAVKDAIEKYVSQHYIHPISGGGSGPKIPPKLSAFMIPSGVNFLAQPAAGDDTPPVAHGASTATEATSTVEHVAEEVRNPTASQGSHPSTAESGEPGSGGPNVIHDWTARVHFKSYELGQSFLVLIFLGDVPDDPSQWMRAPSYVGSHAAFVNSAAEQCDNCQSQIDTLSEGFVHLNSALARRSGLSSFEPDVVTPYVRENLHWRIRAVRHCAIVHRETFSLYYSFRLTDRLFRWIRSRLWRSP